MEVGVRELKQRLSEFLERAERGEIICVTDRGRPKALLGPLPGRANVQQGIAEGWITPPANDDPPRPARRFAVGRSVTETLTEDRGE